MNSADSERMAGCLEEAGYRCVEEAGHADVLVYNTCSIREKAELKLYSALGRQAKRKRQHMGDLKIVVAGCVAAQEGHALLRRVPEVDLVMGPHHANRIGDLLEQVEAGSQVVAVEHAPIEEDITAPRRDSAITAWVNVIHGCNEKVCVWGEGGGRGCGGWRTWCCCGGRLVVAMRGCVHRGWRGGMECHASPARPSPLTAPRALPYRLPPHHPAPPPTHTQCTYCIVPFTRGQEQSRTPEAIRREMLSLGEAGYREVTLLGQNVDAYGRDLPGFAPDNSGRRAWTFTDLLRHVHDVPGGRRRRRRRRARPWAAVRGREGEGCAAGGLLGAGARAGLGWAPGAGLSLWRALPHACGAGIARIRFATSHPRYFTERLIRWAGGRWGGPQRGMRACIHTCSAAAPAQHGARCRSPAPAAAREAGRRAGVQERARGAGPDLAQKPPPHPRRACAELDKLCEFFHVPFQSGDNDILREMKRGGGRACVCVCVAPAAWGARPPPSWPPHATCCLPSPARRLSHTTPCPARLPPPAPTHTPRLHPRAVPRDGAHHPAPHARRLHQRRRHRGVPRGERGAV